jgi:23S rRNA pseudouridine2605 synthase
LKVRLQKFLAEAGVASRRAGEQMILDGRVRVNGETVQTLGTKVDTVHDHVDVDGKRARTKKKLYLAMNKPPGYICSRKDECSRRVVFDLLPVEWGNLFTVGRLDADSEGLLFLTNDGDFCLKVTHPRYQVPKTYLATVEKEVIPRAVRRLTEGIEDAGETLKAEKARLVSSNHTASVIELELTEGKNREVRRMLAAQGMNVVQLRRIKIGKIKLGELPLGKWRTLTEPEIKSLLPAL